MHMMDTYNTSICTNALTGRLLMKIYNIILIIYVHNKGVKSFTLNVLHHLLQHVCSTC